MIAFNPRIGDRTFCLFCGHPIECLGAYWRHLGGTPAHQAAPDFDSPYERASVGRSAELALALPSDYQI